MTLTKKKIALSMTELMEIQNNQGLVYHADTQLTVYTRTILFLRDMLTNPDKSREMIKLGIEVLMFVDKEFRDKDGLRTKIKWFRWFAVSAFFLVTTIKIVKLWQK